VESTGAPLESTPLADALWPLDAREELPLRELEALATVEVAALADDVAALTEDVATPEDETTSDDEDTPSDVAAVPLLAPALESVPLTAPEESGMLVPPETPEDVVMMVDVPPPPDELEPLPASKCTHTPAWQSPPVQGVPSAEGWFSQRPVAASHVCASWHSVAGAHVTDAAPPAHKPAWHCSPWVQASPSVQGVPSACAGLVQVPVPMSHVPAVWHWSSGGQSALVLHGQLLVAGSHRPAWHVSPAVHERPSLQANPSGTLGLEQTPVAGSHAPARWHWSSAAQVTLAMGWPHTPPWHASPAVHSSLSLHAVASVLST
jgi:hypothetical protein